MDNQEDPTAPENTTTDTRSTTSSSETSSSPIPQRSPYINPQARIFRPQNPSRHRQIRGNRPRGPIPSAISRHAALAHTTLLPHLLPSRPSPAYPPTPLAMHQLPTTRSLLSPLATPFVPGGYNPFVPRGYYPQTNPQSTSPSAIPIASTLPHRSRPRSGAVTRRRNYRSYPPREFQIFEFFRAVRETAAWVVRHVAALLRGFGGFGIVLVVLLAEMRGGGEEGVVIGKKGVEWARRREVLRAQVVMLGMDVDAVWRAREVLAGMMVVMERVRRGWWAVGWGVLLFVMTFFWETAWFVQRDF